MKLKIKNGIIYTEIGDIVGTIVDNSPDEVERTIEVGSKALVAIQGFVDKVNSGSFKPRSAVKEFEKLLEEYKDE